LSPPILPLEVFLSHSSKDRHLAEQVVGILQEYNIPVFYAPTHLKGAREWLKVVGVALDRCDWFLLLLTPNAVESMWVDRELQYALMQPRYRDRIVPVLCQPCDFKKLSWTLQLFEIIGFPDCELSERQLLRVWGIERRFEIPEI